MNQIIYIVGHIVVVMVVLSFLGLQARSNRLLRPHLAGWASSSATPYVRKTAF